MNSEFELCSACLCHLFEMDKDQINTIFLDRISYQMRANYLFFLLCDSLLSNSFDTC
jgi:hypothetical protein